LCAQDEKGSFSVMIFGDNGPLSNVEVALTQDSSFSRIAISDSLGEATFYRIDKGDYILTLSHPEYIDSTFERKIIVFDIGIYVEMESFEKRKEYIILRKKWEYLSRLKLQLLPFYGSETIFYTDQILKMPLRWESYYF
jgi:hypothetical protein